MFSVMGPVSVCVSDLLSAVADCEKDLIITFKVSIYYNNPVIYAHINMLIQSTGGVGKKETSIS